MSTRLSEPHRRSNDDQRQERRCTSLQGSHRMGAANAEPGGAASNPLAGNSVASAQVREELTGSPRIPVRPT